MTLTNNELDNSATADGSAVQGTECAGGKSRKNRKWPKTGPHTVYIVTLNGSDKCYVGITHQPVKNRWSQHVRNARQNKKGHFYNALRLYGAEAFDWQVLCVCEDRDSAKQCEITWIAAGWSHYNKTKGGDGNSPGYVTSEEARRKISAALKGKKKPPISEELRKWRSQHQKGKPISEQAKRKISEAMKGRPAHNKGVKVSAESREKMSQAQLARQASIPKAPKPIRAKSGSPEHLKKIAKALTGVKQDPERVAKRRLTLIRNNEMRKLMAAMGPLATEVILDG